MKQMRRLAMFAVTGCCLCASAWADGVTTNRTGGTPMTFADLLQGGMTTFLGREITLRARTLWEYATVKIPEDPTPEDQLRRKAGPLLIPFGGPEFRDVATACQIRATGADLKQQPGADGRMEYAFKGSLLSNGGKEYLLTVRLKLRARFKPTLLDNPAFVKQSNNPTYWGQTFEMEILNIQVAGSDGK